MGEGGLGAWGEEQEKEAQRDLGCIYSLKQLSLAPRQPGQRMELGPAGVGKAELRTPAASAPETGQYHGNRFNMEFHSFWPNPTLSVGSRIPPAPSYISLWKLLGMDPSERGGTVVYYSTVRHLPKMWLTGSWFSHLLFKICS